MGYDGDWWSGGTFYWVFMFQDAASAVQFKLVFGEHTCEFNPSLDEYYRDKIIRWNHEERGEFMPLDDE